MTEKLVRDRIPEIIETSSGQTASFRIADEAEMPNLLIKKLGEELEELEEAIKKRSPSKIIDELADISEALYALGGQADISSDAIKSRIREKRLKRGGFNKRIVMDF